MAQVLEFPKQQKETVLETAYCSACKTALHGLNEHEYTQNNYNSYRVIAFCDSCEKEMQAMGIL